MSQLVPGARPTPRCHAVRVRLWRRAVEGVVREAVREVTQERDLQQALPWNFGFLSDAKSDLGIPGAPWEWRYSQPWMVDPATADKAWEAVHRTAGWLRAIPDNPAVRRFVLSTQSGNGRNSPETLCDLWAVIRRWPSPGRFGRWLVKVRRRAQQILAPWDLHPSWEAVAVVSQIGRRRVGRAALQVAALTVRIAGQVTREEVRDAAELLLAHKGGSLELHRPVVVLRMAAPLCGRRRPGDHTYDHLPLARRGRDWPGDWSEALGKLYGLARTRGPWWRIREIVFACDEGAIVRGPRPSDAAVVVTDPSDGTQVRLGVPGRFAKSLRAGETASQRVRASIAWTFWLKPDQYEPEIET